MHIYTNSKYKSTYTTGQAPVIKTVGQTSVIKKDNITTQVHTYGRHQLKVYFCLGWTIAQKWRGNEMKCNENVRNC